MGEYRHSARPTRNPAGALVTWGLAALALLAVLYTQSPEPDDHAVLRKKLGEVAALSVALDANEASRDAAAVARDAAVAEAAAIAEEAAARAVEAAQRAAVSPPPVPNPPGNVR